MENVGRPLDFVTLNDIIMQTDYVMYLDFAEAFHKMLDDGLIAEEAGGEGDALYRITAKGRTVAESLHSDILSSILDKSLTAALRYLDFKQRGVEVHCHHTRREDGRFEVHCALLEKDTVIFETTLVVNSADHAKRMADNFRDRPEVIYRGAHALLAGNMNFLLD
jgi:hypothetical protein